MKDTTAWESGVGVGFLLLRLSEKAPDSAICTRGLTIIRERKANGRKEETKDAGQTDNGKEKD